MNLTEDGPVPEQCNGVYVTQPFFGLLRQRPVMGRDFRPDEDQPGAAPAAIISHTLWQNRYNGAADVLGRVIKANTLQATVIGVMPPGMRFPFNVDVWLPYAQLPPSRTLSGGRCLTVRAWAGWARVSRSRRRARRLRR